MVQAQANEIDTARAMQKALIKWDLTLQGEIDVIFGSGGAGGWMRWRGRRSGGCGGRTRTNCG